MTVQNGKKPFFFVTKVRTEPGPGDTHSILFPPLFFLFSLWNVTCGMYAWHEMGKIGPCRMDYTPASMCKKPTYHVLVKVKKVKKV